MHKNVVEIAENAFQGWTSLEEIVFEPGSRLERIGDHAFAGTALKEFVAPENLKVIGSDAFDVCPAKNNLVFRGNGVFNNETSNNSDDFAYYLEGNRVRQDMRGADEMYSLIVTDSNRVFVSNILEKF